MDETVEDVQRMSRKQARYDRLIVALLQCRTVAEAAHSAGLTERHTWRLLADSEFKAKLEAARERVFGVALGRVQAAIVDATTVLLDLVNREDVSASVRVAAARVLLEAAWKSWEGHSLERRIAALEERHEKQN